MAMKFIQVATVSDFWLSYDKVMFALCKSTRYLKSPTRKMFLLTKTKWP